MTNPKDHTFTPKQALEMRLPLLDAFTGCERRGAFGLFTLGDLATTLDEHIRGLQEDRDALSQVIEGHGRGQLIAECGLSDAELGRLFLMVTRIAEPAGDINVHTPDDRK